jgi:2-methylcitrate dehydratase PrpD
VTEVTEPLATVLARWVTDVPFERLPQDVVHATRLRILDAIGLALAGADTPFGRSVLDAERALSPDGPCRVFGSAVRLPVRSAAFVNGARVQALEFDDTHNESIVHMSGPVVAAALALAQTRRIHGRDILRAVAIGNEVSCRVGSVAVGQFHKRGFHPTGLFTPFGVTCLASTLMGLDGEATSRAMGIVGSFASGLLECWVDGTDSKFLHAGWAARAGISAAALARAGTSGPPAILEGRFGLFASHVQDLSAPRDFTRISHRLGDDWESRRASFKPFPAAHVLHPYISAVLRLRERHALGPDDVLRIDCPVASFIIGIVCEPVDEKWTPRTRSHGRVSLQFSLAEALATGRLAKDAYGDEARRDPAILALARRVHYHPDPRFDGLAHFPGEVTVTLRDGRTLTEAEPYNRGSAQNPMTDEELRAKFDDNAGGRLSASARARLRDAVMRLDEQDDAGVVAEMTAG